MNINKFQEHAKNTDTQASGLINRCVELDIAIKELNDLVNSPDLRKRHLNLLHPNEQGIVRSLGYILSIVARMASDMEISLESIVNTHINNTPDIPKEF